MVTFEGQVKSPSGHCLKEVEFVTLRISVQGQDLCVESKIELMVGPIILGVG